VRYLAIASLVSLSLGATAFSACSSSNSSGGGTGGGGTGGGAGTIITGGGGGTTSGGGTGGGNTGGTGNTGGSATCQAAGESCTDNCFDLGCDPSCAQAGDPSGPCCSDYQTACVANAVTLPAGCVDPNVFLSLCDPTTNDPCGAGNACDKAGADQYWTGVNCYGGDNTVPVGGTCDPANQVFCVGGATCDVAASGQPGTCKKWCCADSDCGGGTCAAIDATNLGTLGLCEAGGTDGGTGGAGGAGGAAGAAGTTGDASTD
jgi:hypothetical protein